jgi:hypothetical protein
MFALQKLGIQVRDGQQVMLDSAIDSLKPGVSTDRVVQAFPKAQEIDFESKMAAFGLNFCHGLGLSGCTSGR